MPSASKRGKGGSDVLGDAARIREQAILLLRYGAIWAEHRGSDGWIKSISIYPPWATRNGSWMVVGHGFQGSERVVAFHRADNILSLLVGFFTRAAQNKLDWKPDKYAAEGVLHQSSGAS